MIARKSTVGRAFDRMLIALVIGLVIWVYQWMPGSFPSRTLESTPTGYYNELADAWRHGHLYLDRAPDPRLVALGEAAYDPRLNEEYRVNDLSYFKGRYYLYMGPVPALTLFVPIRLITGLYLSPGYAGFIFCAVAFLAGVAVLGLVAHHRPDRPDALRLAIAIIAFGLAGGFYLGLEGELAQVLAVDSAYAWGMIALWAGTRALFLPRHRMLWLTIAGCAYGLAIGSRPNYLFGAVALIPLLLSACPSSLPPQPPCKRWFPAVICLASLGVVLALILAHNFARFGNIAEFGARYQLGGWNQRGLAYLGSDDWRENLYYYLWGPASLSRYFPFVRASSWTAIGMIRYLPWLWFLPAVIVGLGLRPKRDPSASLVFSVLILATVNLFTLVLLPSGNPASVRTSANARYALDFLPFLGLSVSLFIITFDWRPLSRPALTVSYFILGGFAMTSALVDVSLRFSVFPDASYRPLAAMLDWLPARLSARNVDTYGPVAIELEFPTGKTGAYEPILSTGSAEAGDLIYAYYASPSQIRFGHVSTQATEPIGPPVPLNYSVPHRLTIAFGALYPPPGHPLLSNMDGFRLEALARTLEITLDGTSVLTSASHANPSRPDHVRLGENRTLTSYSQPAFSGRLLAWSRLPMSAAPIVPPNPPRFGAVHLQVKFPRGVAQHISEPLLATGVAGAGDIIAVEYRGEREVRLRADHWGHAPIASAWIPIDFSKEHSCMISMGSLLPPPGSGSAQPPLPESVTAIRSRLEVTLDGKFVLNQPYDAYESPPDDVTIGQNAIGASSCVAAFTGTVRQTARGPTPNR